MRLFIPSLFALAGSATAVGNALVLNNSTSPFYVWSVSSTVGPQQKVVPGMLKRPTPYIYLRIQHHFYEHIILCVKLTALGGLYMEPLHRDDKTGGVALKITKNAGGLYSGDAQQVFAYNLEGSETWYDLSTVFGEPFLGERVEVMSNTGGSIIWANGSNPGGSQVKVAPSNENIWFSVYSTA